MSIQQPHEKAATPLVHSPTASFAMTTALVGPLRRGKWTPAEEEYAAAIIHHFLAGVLSIQYGTTLRGYIAQLLHCDPMRVSKKLIPGSVFVGVSIDAKVGRRSYYPLPVDTPGLDGRKRRAEHHLAELRAAFVASLEKEDELRDVKSSQLGDPRLLSPRSYGRQRHDEESDVSPAGGAVSPSTPPKLPSLNEMLRQNRLKFPQPHQLRSPQPTTCYQDYSTDSIYRAYPVHYYAGSPP